MVLETIVLTITPKTYIWYTPTESNCVYLLIREALKTVENKVHIWCPYKDSNPN